MPDRNPARWPALMRADTAAEYLDISKSLFLRDIAPQLPSLRPSSGGQVVGYLRADIDAWLAAQAGIATPTPRDAGGGGVNPWFT